MIPAHARVVIVGGGVMGCGLAYHLGHEGWSDVVLLEKAELTSGSTWHAAGQITHSTSSFSLGKCVGYNIELYSRVLEAETGQSVTWHGCGSFRLAYTQDELDWLQHTLSVGKALGFPMELVKPQHIRELHPFYNLDGVIAALYTPDDGHVDPAGVTFALAQGARQRGVKIVRRCRVTDIKPAPNGEWRVFTEQGEIVCEHVVNAGGTYARQMGDWVGLDIPTTSMTHHYFITDTVPEFLVLDRELPVVRDDRLVSGYIRMEQKSGLIGIYEKANPNTVWLDGCPWEAENELFAPDYDRIMPWLENAMGRMPVLAELGIKRDVHGAISHPPDGNPLIGPAPGLSNFWLNCGCQIGIGWGPGLTRELARWMVHGAADINMRDYDPRRFGGFADQSYQVTKAKEDYLLRHEIPFPHLNRLDGRPVKPSALYERLKAKGAVFEEVYGWERPRWFARGGIEQRDYYSFRRAAWHDTVAQEVIAVRECAGIMDISAFSKVEVSGPDAAAFVDRLIPNRLPAKPGRIALTHLLNDQGRIELETTLVRLAEDRFYLACAAFFEQRLIDYLNRHRRSSETVTVANLSSDWGALALNGPRARDILGACTSAALDNSVFPWLRAQAIDIAGARMWAFRLSYAGELGWEIHGPRADLLPVYDALWQAGEQHDLVDYGSFAMNAMRMEKMFKGAGELTNEVTLPEADVMRFVRLDKPDFVGKAATEIAMANPPRWLCVYLDIDADGINDGHGGEAVLADGDCIGSTSSIVFCHGVQKLLAFAYVKPQYAEPGTRLDVMIMGEPRAAVVLGEPVYDPPVNAREAKEFPMLNAAKIADATLSQDDYYAVAEATLPGAGLGGYALPEDVRFIIREGHGGRLVSVDGREYVDFVCGAGATIIGHDHPDVIAAVQARVGKGLHFFGTLNDAAVELAEVLVQTIPCAERIIFTTTGSEATAYCMRIARAVSGKPKILKFEGAYHGNHDYAAFSQFPTRPANYPMATADVGGVPQALQDTMMVAPYNDLETVESILTEHANEIAAIIVEPVQRIIFPKPGFLEGLRRLADEYGVLLIFDEVVTGFRLSLAGAQGYFGVQPDLASYGKIVGGGGPLGCVGGRAELLDATNPNRKGRADYAYINGTLHGNPIAAVAGLATVRVLQEPGFYKSFHARADRFRVVLQGVLDRHGLPAMVAGQASFWQILFSDREPANQMDVLASGMKRSYDLDLELLRHGVYVLPNVRRFFSAAHTDEDLERTLAALEAACVAQG